MTLADFKYFTVGGNKYTVHHVITFFLTFFSYSLFHASRKTFSNVKTTVSNTWLESCDIGTHNSSCVELRPDYIWNDHHLFDTKNQAKIFLGELDAIFLTAYSIVIKNIFLFKLEICIIFYFDDIHEGSFHQWYFR